MKPNVEEIKNDQKSDWDVEISIEAFENLEDTIMCIIKHSETILKKNTLLQDSLQKAESKHGEFTQSDFDLALV